MIDETQPYVHFRHCLLATLAAIEYGCLFYSQLSLHLIIVEGTCTDKFNSMCELAGRSLQ